MPPKPLLELDVDEARAAIAHTGGNLIAASRVLGIPKKTFDRWLVRHMAVRDEAAQIRERLMREALFEPDEDLVIGAIANFNGNIWALAKQFKTPRTTFLAYVERHPRVREALVEAEEDRIDIAEASLMRSVQNGEAWAVSLLLKTKGKRRGYIERSDSLNINIDLTKLSVEQLERLAAGEHPANVLGTHDESSVVGVRAYPAPTESAG